MGHDGATLSWRPTNAPVASSRTDDIWFIDPSTGWAVNSNGQILKTFDGGATWVEQFRSTAYLRCVGFANASRGWVGTLSGSQRLYHTRDGGRSWALVTNIPAVAPSAICGLSVVNESVIYASGTNFPDQPPRMMKSIDGGEIWTGWDMSQHATLLVDTFFATPDRGWVVGGKATVPNPTRDDVKPVVLFTDDGGRTWTNRVASMSDDFPFGEWGWKIQFLDERTGFVSLENLTAAAILKTTDGGLSWVRKAVEDPQGNANLEGIGFLDDQQGWVGGWGTEDFTGGFSSETQDGGSTWQNANHIGRFINRFRFFGTPVTIGYASGRTVFKYSREPVPVPGPTLQALERTDEPRWIEGSERIEIVYDVPADARAVAIDIWDRFGRYVRKLRDDGHPPAGRTAVAWDLASDAGTPAPPGIYIYRITIDAAAESGIIRLLGSPPGA